MMTPITAVEEEAAAAATPSPPRPRQARRGGEVAYGTEITLATTTEGAGIYYTTEGTDSGISSDSLLYEDSNKPKIELSSLTLKAKTLDPNKYFNEPDAYSEVLTAVYTVSGAGPRIWTAVTDTTFDGDNYITAIAWGGTEGQEKFVAVGTSGKAAYSSDGITWTAVSDTTFDDDDDINAIAWGGGKFVAGGDNGKMAYSSDGESWTAVSDTTFNDNDYILAIAWGGGKFVAGGYKGKAAYSSDGITWTAVSDTTFNTNDGRINAIAWGGTEGQEKFVAVGKGLNTQSSDMAYSSDGITWTAVTGIPFYHSILAIAWGGGKFVAGGDEMAYSSDGITWTQVNESADAIAWSKGIFTTGYRYSTDGVTWSGISYYAPAPNGNIKGIAYGGNRFVAVSDEGIAYSQDVLE
jgi:sporulation protein YlmC with PRC-barrel domain